MQDGIFHHIPLIVLAALLLTAAFTDLRSRRIANWLNASIAIAAPLYWWTSGLSLWPGVAIQLGMAMAAFACLSVLFALRAMGGGDVKLLTALALWFDPASFLRLLFMMALVGGLLTIGMGAWHVMRRQRDRLAIPYGVAIAAGGLWILGVRYLAETPAHATVLG